MNSRQRDDYLELLLDPYIEGSRLAEGQEGQFFSCITVILNGTVISGRPISIERYYRLTYEEVVRSVERDLGDQTAKDSIREAYEVLFDNLSADALEQGKRLQALEQELDEEIPEGQLYTDQQEALLDEHRRTYLHLEDVTIYSGEQRIRSGLLRIRLADINGWALGGAGGRD